MNVNDIRSASAAREHILMSQCYFADAFLYHSRSVVTLAFLPRSDSNGPLVSTETCRGVCRDCSDGAAPRRSRCCVLQLSGLMRREALGWYTIIISLVIQCSCICMDHSGNWITQQKVDPVCICYILGSLKVSLAFGKKCETHWRSCVLQKNTPPRGWLLMLVEREHCAGWFDAAVESVVNSV